MMGARFFGAVLSLWVWGDLLVQLARADRVMTTSIGRLGLGWLLGCGSASLLAFLLMWLGLPLTSAVTVVSTLGAMLWSGCWLRMRWEVRRSDCPSAQVRPATSSPLPALSGSSRILPAIFVALIVADLALVVHAAVISPLVAWDAWVNWASRARVLLIDQGLSSALHPEQARLATNPGYPLMLPLVEAWCFTWMGQFSERVVGGIAVLFLVALLALTYEAVRRMTKPTAALGFTTLLATAPRVDRGAHCGLADLPLAGLVLAAMYLIALWREEPREPHAAASRGGRLPLLFLAALAIGLLPWFKQEGWVWLVVIVSTVLAGSMIDLRAGRVNRREAVGTPGVLLAIALPVALIWPVFLALHPAPSFAFLPITAASILEHLQRVPPIALAMLERLFNRYWNLIWHFTALALLVRRGRALRAPAGWAIVPVLAYLLLISASYLLSRFDPWLSHLNNSAERLMLQALPVTTWWLAGQFAAPGRAESDQTA